MVISGALPAGARVNEAELAEQLGISRGPLREAIQRVGAEGLVELRGNRGAFVREISMEDVRLIYEVRGALESAAAQRAARVASAAEIADLERQLAQVDEIIQSGDAQNGDSNKRVLELTNDFHITILELCQNPYLQRYGNDLHIQLRVARLHSEHTPERAKQVLEEHRSIVAAISKRDGAAASEAMSEHLMNSLARFEAQPPDDNG
jgi:DNA-binding GntR family transcriptional regulator